MKNRSSEVARRVVLVLVLVAVVAVVAHLLLSLYFTPERIVARKLEVMTKDYYENYFYPNYAGGLSEAERNELMAKSEAGGFSRTYLRQLLLYDGGKYADFAKYFKYQGYTCDTNKSYVMYYPVAPFAATDYRVEYSLSCG